MTIAAINTTNHTKHTLLEATNMVTKPKPIYRILLFSKIPTLDEHGWPDCGTQDDVGFYYEYETAVRAMHENWCDIRECMFEAGFILTLYPGCYDSATKDRRTYFEWDEERDGFFEKEEPDCLEHFSY